MRKLEKIFLKRSTVKMPRYQNYVSQLLMLKRKQKIYTFFYKRQTFFACASIFLTQC